MSTTLNKVILKEFQQTNLQSFSDGQISIAFPQEEDLTRVEVTLTPSGGHYQGGTFVFGVNLPQNYPDSVASVSCKTKIFHPNIDFSGYICFNILTDEWNSSVRLMDYAHALLWLLYQPNLNSRLNGAVPSDELEYAQLVKQTLQGMTVAGITFPQMIPPDPEPIQEEPRFTVAQRVAMFNAPHPPPPPPRFFRMRIPTTNAAPTPVVAAPLPQTLAIIDAAAPLPPPLPPSDFRFRIPLTPVPIPEVAAQGPAPQPQPEPELHEEEREEAPRPRQLMRSGDAVPLATVPISWTPPVPVQEQAKAGISQEKQSKRGSRSRNHRKRATAAARKMPQRRQAAAH